MTKDTLTLWIVDNLLYLLNHSHPQQTLYPQHVATFLRRTAALETSDWLINVCALSCGKWTVSFLAQDVILFRFLVYLE